MFKVEIKLIEIPEICPVCNKKITVAFNPNDFKPEKSGLWQFAMICPYSNNSEDPHVIVVSVDKDFRIRRKYGYLLIDYQNRNKHVEISKNISEMLIKLFKNEALKWAIYGNEFDFFIKNAEILRIKLISNVDEIAKMNNPKISMRFVHMIDENKRLIEYVNKLSDIQYFLEFLITLIYLEQVKAVEFYLD